MARVLFAVILVFSLLQFRILRGHTDRDRWPGSRGQPPIRTVTASLGAVPADRPPPMLFYDLVMAAAAALALPVAWVVVTSLKPSADIIRLPPEWIPWPATLAHYHEVLLGSSRTARIGRAFANSLVKGVATGSVVVVLATSAMAAYPLARMRFPGRDLVFAVLVGSLMIPKTRCCFVPQYVLTQHLGWLSTYQGLIVPEAAMSLRLRGLPSPPVLPDVMPR